MIFLDTEFTELGLNPKLISIGLVSLHGECFYAELTDTWRLDDCSQFVRIRVLPALDGQVLMTQAQLTLQLRNWIEQFQAPVTLVSDSEYWDWRWIGTIFAAPGSWPCNLAHQPFIMPSDAQLAEAIEQSYQQHRVLRRHHALDDARANRLGWLLWPAIHKIGKIQDEQ